MRWRHASRSSSASLQIWISIFSIFCSTTFSTACSTFLGWVSLLIQFCARRQLTVSEVSASQRVFQNMNWTFFSSSKMCKKVLKTKLWRRRQCRHSCVHILLAILTWKFCKSAFLSEYKISFVNVFPINHVLYLSEFSPLWACLSECPSSVVHLPLNASARKTDNVTSEKYFLWKI